MARGRQQNGPPWVLDLGVFLILTGRGRWRPGQASVNIDPKADERRPTLCARMYGPAENGLLERHLAGEVATGEAAGRDFAKRRRLGAAARDGVAAAWMKVAA